MLQITYEMNYVSSDFKYFISLIVLFFNNNIIIIRIA